MWWLLKTALGLRCGAVGVPRRPAHHGWKANSEVSSTSTRVLTRETRSGELLRWLLFYHRRCLWGPRADSIQGAGNENVLHYNKLRFHKWKLHTDIYISLVWHDLTAQMGWRKNSLPRSPTPSYKGDCSQVCRSNRSCKMLQKYCWLLPQNAETPR